MPYLILLFMLCFAFSLSAVADDASQDQEALKEQRKAAEESFALIKKMAEGLDENQKKHFYTIYNNYNLMSTVEVVRTDLANAVEACSEKNPDLADQMHARYEQWTDAVNPVLDEAEANISNMVIAQDYASKARYDELFSKLDHTREQTNARIDKVPVTSESACKFMLRKMNETQDRMVNLLRETLVSFPQKFPSSSAPSGEGNRKL